jgi:hypothetical protein
MEALLEEVGPRTLGLEQVCTIRFPTYLKARVTEFPSCLYSLSELLLPQMMACNQYFVPKQSLRASLPSLLLREA